MILNVYQFFTGAGRRVWEEKETWSDPSAWLDRKMWEEEILVIQDFRLILDRGKETLVIQELITKV